MPFEITRIQLPLRLAFTTAINKAQDYTFPEFGCLNKPLLTHNQD